jgi:hypothetical protein
MDRPFEARMAEIDVELRNLRAEMGSLRTAIDAVERCSVDARSKFEAVMSRSQNLMADFAMLRADVRRTT